MAAPTYNGTKAAYRAKWDGARLDVRKTAEADRFVSLIMRNRAKYAAVEDATGVPWFWIAAVHMRESSCDFRGVLHNGEHIIGTGRLTRLVPKGRGPFSTWEQAAIDAIRLHGLQNIGDWPIARLLYEAERFNGFGYASKGRPSPYVWSGTQWYSAGKYVADGVYSPSAVDSQLGVVIVLKRLQAAGVRVDTEPKLAPKTTPDPAPIPPPTRHRAATPG